MADEIDASSEARLFVAEAALADVIRKDDEFVLDRGAHGQHKDGPRPPLLFLTPVSTRPTPQTLEKIEHEYSLRDALNSAWAVRPVALPQPFEQPTLELDDPLQFGCFVCLASLRPVRLHRATGQLPSTVESLLRHVDLGGGLRARFALFLNLDGREVNLETQPEPLVGLAQHACAISGEVVDADVS